MIYIVWNRIHDHHFPFPALLIPPLPTMSSHPQTIKKCPHCAEEILADAKKCKHCGEFLDGKRIRNYKGIKPSVFNGFNLRIACPNCGYEGKPKTHVDGSMGVEIALWFFFLLPGIIYSVWRGSTKCYVCPKCGCKQISKI